MRLQQNDMSKTVRLASLVPGDTAIISYLEECPIMLKLMEMGCLPGELIKVNFTAPLGDPIAIQVSGYSLSLRKEEARMVHVTPLAK